MEKFKEIARTVQYFSGPAFVAIHRAIEADVGALQRPADGAHPAHDEVKRAYEAAASANGPLVAFKCLLVMFWLCATNTKLKLQDLNPPDLLNSACLDVLSQQLQAQAGSISVADAVTSSGVASWELCELMLANAAAHDDRGEDPFWKRALPCLEFFVEEVAVKRWGLHDPWNEDLSSWGGDGRDVLRAAAGLGIPRLVAFLLSKGCNPNGSFAKPVACCPMLQSCVAGQEECFDLLLEQDLDLTRPYADGMVGIIAFVNWACQASTSASSDLSARQLKLGMLRRLVTRFPAAVSCAQCTTNNGPVLEPLLVAVQHGSADCTRVLLEAGAPIRYHFETTAGGNPLNPTAIHMFASNLEVFNLLVKEYGALDDWRERYDDKTCRMLAAAVSMLAVRAYPLRPGASPNIGALSHDPSLMSFLDAVLASGFVYNWDTSACNALLNTVAGNLISTTDTISLLRKFKAAGFEVAKFAEEGDTLLTHWIATSPKLGANDGEDSRRLMDFAIFEVGCRVDALCTSIGSDNIPQKRSALTVAIDNGHDELALHLMTKHNARVTYPELSWHEQPITKVIWSTNIPEHRRLALLRGLISRDKTHLTLPCFQGNREDLTVYTPLQCCVMHKRIKELAVILESGMPGAEELVNRVHMQTGKYLGTAPQWAAYYKEWEALSALMRHTKVRVNFKCQPQAGETAVPLPSVLTFGNQWQRARGSTLPRALFALISSAGKRELEEEKTKGQAAPATTKASAATGAGATTNAFEDPSLRLISEKEAKAKAKKKAAKKKSKAKKKKKKAANEANAGAGSAEPAAEESDDDDSDSDDEPFEEPDDNLVDSRYAPSLDLMLAAMGIVPGDESAGAPAGEASGGASSSK